ncbi:hypothetical protein SAMN02745196_02002 [Clostridium collagenovorans DSM 3089]|uniref:Uncharacterized protein n=1 Tax=Clostridium collagenovorans DSM 3089 TaxID=1121306 RepID=A0A1M5X4P9_9CLOT|nr:hypothetical protein SAMN02745196_02002 [Clostridium collagenovorans DSM 3089]
MCHTGIVEVLYRNNLSYTRLTNVMKNLIKKRENFEALKNYLKGEIGHILFEDESMPMGYQAIQKT